MPPLHDISTDGVTVWVNGAASLLGRFGRFGIDVHRSIEEQKRGGECLFCTHGEMTYDDWQLFQRKMLEFYDIEVPEEYVPQRFLVRGASPHRGASA